ncbi:MAG: ABC-ATPase domain-containing protein [Gemmatimonadota bacterium]
MRTIQQLSEHLRRLDNRGYKAYREIEAAYDAGDFTLYVDHVQGDPYAAPSRVRVVLPAATAGVPVWALESRIRRIAAGDFFNRTLFDRLDAARGTAGSGHSGELRVLRPGQQVLERASVGVGADGQVVARLRAGLPARGRRILGRSAARLLTEILPAAVRASLRYEALDAAAFRRHVETVEDADALRRHLAERGLVAFVADGARLPRRSGVDDRPLEGDVVAFQAPETLRVTLQAPHAGTVAGLGVPVGVTLIAGGGYHGKSTLLRGIQAGVYDHIPGDGRERVVAVDTAVKVRAEDGRRVEGVDIGNFIGPLPGGQDTRCFRTENASGSTSQAAAIVEALEVGATALLLDEDTSATNFMIRDARVQRLTPREEEPITPFIDRARQLADDRGVSTILVVGGSGDYFDVADTVLTMRAYVPQDVTAEAKRIVHEMPAERRWEGGPWSPVRRRVPLPASIDPSRGRRSVKIRTRSEDRVSFGTEEVELDAVEQIVEQAQTRAMAEALVWARGRAIDGRRDMTAALAHVAAAVREHGLDVLHPDEVGEMAAFRIFELAAFVNRLRSLEIRAGEEE